jgi:hypothetical protein
MRGRETERVGEREIEREREREIECERADSGAVDDSVG